VLNGEIQTLNLVHPQESNRQQLQFYFWTLKKQAIEGTRIRQLWIDVRTDWSIMGRFQNLPC